jgi:hypothetical protein
VQQFSCQNGIAALRAGTLLSGRFVFEQITALAHDGGGIRKWDFLATLGSLSARRAACPARELGLREDSFVNVSALAGSYPQLPSVGGARRPL